MPEEQSRRRLPAGIGAILGALAFGALLYLVPGLGPDDNAGVDLDQPLPALRRESVELQVAVHDLVERARAGTAIRVCRAVASRHVRLDRVARRSLRSVLEELALQSDTRLVVRPSEHGGPSLPTLACSAGIGDYLVIGPPGGHRGASF